MKTIKDLLEEIKVKTYMVDDYYKKEIFNERFFAISILFIWHMAYSLLNSKGVEDDTILQKCNSVMDTMKTLPTSYYSNLSYDDLVKDIFSSYWKIHPINVYDDNEEKENKTLKSQILKMLENTCRIIENWGSSFYSIFKYLTATSPEDKDGFIKVVASIVSFKDGDISTKLPSLLCNLLNLRPEDSYIGLAPSSPFCIHTSFLVYHGSEMSDAVIVAYQPAATYMYLNLLRCYSGTIVVDDFFSPVSYGFTKAIYIAPAEKTKVNGYSYDATGISYELEESYKSLDDNGIEVFVSPSSYFAEDKNNDGLMDFLTSTCCIESIICLPSQYKGDCSSTLLFLIRKKREEESDLIQVIDIFNKDGNGQLYISTPYASFPYSITQDGKNYIKDALDNKISNDSKIKYVPSASLKEELSFLVKTETWSNEGRESISALLDSLELLIKEARDFLK